MRLYLSYFEKQDKILKDQQAKLESFKNAEEYKRQTLARSQEMGAKQIALYEKQIQESVDKVSKYQSRMGTILSKRGGLPKKRDMLKRLTMAEKFVSGLTLQIQKPGAWLVDINPSLRYRLTSYWSIGTGWNERVLFGKYQLTRDQARVCGVRSFTEVVIFRGLAARLDAEGMNTFIVSNQQTQTLANEFGYGVTWRVLRRNFHLFPK